MSKEKSPTKTNNINNRIPQKPRYEKEYDDFVLWLSLPSLLRGKSTDELERLGFDDVIIHELLELRYQRDFANKFGVDESQLTRWKKRAIDKGDIYVKRQGWTKGLTSNVLLGLYRKVVSDGNASEVKLWMQLNEDWSEKQIMQHAGEIQIDIKEALKLIHKTRHEQ